MVLPASHGVSRAPRYSGTRRGSLCSFAYEAITLSGPPFHAASARTQVSYFRGALPDTRSGPTTPDGQRRQPITSIQFGLLPVRSPLLGESRLISVPPATEMFHFAGLPAAGYVFTCRSRSFLTWWLPHSEIPGSSLARSSPRLIAACHVLHRRLPPRHPPRALTHFNPAPHRGSQGENLEVQNHPRGRFPTTELLPFPLTSSVFKEPPRTGKKPGPWQLNNGVQSLCGRSTWES